jgi:hypothetical protein
MKQGELSTYPPHAPTPRFFERMAHGARGQWGLLVQQLHATRGGEGVRVCAWYTIIQLMAERGVQTSTPCRFDDDTMMRDIAHTEIDLRSLLDSTLFLFFNFLTRGSTSELD